jgi:hypothetical protein
MNCENLIILGIVAIICLYWYRKQCDKSNYEKFSISANPSNIGGNKIARSMGNPVKASGKPNLSNSVMASPTPVAAEEKINQVHPRINLSRSTCYPTTKLKAEDLLPKATQVKDFVNEQPSAEGVLKNIHFLTAGYNVGVNTVGQSMRNSNLQLRSEPPNPQSAVSPWMQSTIAPDILRKPFEIDENCTA